MLSVFTIDQSEKWDSAVESFTDFDVYYLSGYVKAFMLHGDGEPLLFYYEEDGCRGFCVVMKRDVSQDEHFKGIIPEGKYYDLATPYGYGGWIFEGEWNDAAVNTFSEVYTNWCKDNKIVSEFVRFHPVIENAEYLNDKIYDEIFLGNTVAIQLDDEEAMWARFSSKNRSHIRVAKKEGVEVRTDDSEEAFDIFRSIYETTMDHDDAASYYYFDREFFESIRNDLKGRYTIFTAYLEDRPIASAIMIYAGKYMNYHLSGQLFEYRRYAGTNVILYEASRWGCQKGFEWLHLGGGLGAKEGSLYDFKKSFYKKGEDKKFFIGRKIFDKEAYDELVSLRENELDEGFFPRYRA